MNATNRESRNWNDEIRNLKQELWVWQRRNDEDPRSTCGN